MLKCHGSYFHGALLFKSDVLKRCLRCFDVESQFTPKKCAQSAYVYEIFVRSILCSLFCVIGSSARFSMATYFIVVHRS